MPEATLIELTAVTPEQLQDLLDAGEGAATKDALGGMFVPLKIQPRTAPSPATPPPSTPPPAPER